MFRYLYSRAIKGNAHVSIHLNWYFVVINITISLKLILPAKMKPPGQRNKNFDLHELAVL